MSLRSVLATVVLAMLLASAEGIDIEMPLYGNWCGVGHGGCPTNNVNDCNMDLPCIDKLDCVCKEHDICATRYWFANCRCDADMVQALGGMTSASAVAIRSAIAATPCAYAGNVPYVTTCKKCRRVFGKRVCIDVPCTKTRCQNKIPSFTKSTSMKYSC